ncbi:MAG TPA: hypothetical protein VNY05_34640 [Candidatus Acidoferrales bacterium]|nr:hypothetical protein [Candidatus Acidoferrales bacterium]
MPTIQLTNKTNLNVTASSADGNATLNRYLSKPLSFITPAALDAIAGTKVGNLDPTAFPISASAAGEGKFAVEGTSLDVQLGASASVGLLTGDKAADFLGSLQWTADPSVAGLVSFGLQGTLSAGEAATVSDFGFGITTATTVSVTSFCTAAGGDTLANAVERAMAALTIPHDLQDLGSLPANTTCQIKASSSLKFTASLTYSFLNNPLATISIPHLPSMAVNAKAGATVEATATHTSDHTVTIAKLPNGVIHLSVNLKRTDDFETSLAVSSGVTAKVGNQDAIAFLLDKISPNSTAEVKKLQADMPADQYQKLTGDIKAAIDAALCNSLQASLKAALDDSASTSRIFLYEIDLTALDGAGTAALQSALTGDFTAITSSRAAFVGIREMDSALTVTSTIKHSLTLHLLGIFNWGSTNTFVAKSKVDFTKDTHEIVLSDETIKVVSDNLNAEKLRQVVVKGITLTLPASANTKQAATPITMVFFDRQDGTNRSKMRQFVNVLEATQAPGAAVAESLLDRNLKHYGTSSLYLGLTLTPQRCRQLFLDTAGQPYAWTTYLRYACGAGAAILTGDTDTVSAERLKLFTAGEAFWKDLRDAGTAPKQINLMNDRGIRLITAADVTTLIWWSAAMADYAQALTEADQSLVRVGARIVKDSTGGFDEPWLILATWRMLENPAIESLFTSSLLKP